MILGTPMRDTPMRWEMHACGRHAYEMAYGGCPSMGCIPCEMHAYE
jgi:hypothetical protein